MKRKLDEVIREAFIDAPLPMRVEVQNQIAPLVSLIDRFEPLRQLTLVSLLHDYYIKPIKTDYKLESSVI